MAIAEAPRGIVRERPSLPRHGDIMVKPGHHEEALSIARNHVTQLLAEAGRTFVQGENGPKTTNDKQRQLLVDDAMAISAMPGVMPGPATPRH
jgi:hypothetical protein